MKNALDDCEFDGVPLLVDVIVLVPVTDDDTVLEFIILDVAVGVVNNVLDASELLLIDGLPEGVFDIRAEEVIVCKLVGVFDTLTLIDCVGEPVILLDDELDPVSVFEELNVFVLVVDDVCVLVNTELIDISDDELGVSDSTADCVINSVENIDSV